MENLKCFAAVEFTEDENVAGRYFWYLCEYENVRVGDVVVAPLGRHDRLQKGVVRLVRFAAEYDAPFPVYMIKHIRSIAEK